MEVLPAIIANRRQNCGFEAVAVDNGKIYAFVQSPVRTPATLSNGALNAMRNASPAKNPLLVIANEVSGTTTIYEITKKE